jgi:hypothetical protein
MARKAGDILREHSPFGETTPIEDVLDRELLIEGFKSHKTGYGPALEINGSVDGQEVRILSWSQVLLEEAKVLHKHLPVVAVIRKVKKYYTMSAPPQGQEPSVEPEWEEELEEVPF